MALPVSARQPPSRSRSGGKVVIAARGEEELESTRKEICDAGFQCYAFKADLADLDSCDSLIEQVSKQHGGVDILINNAGRSIRRSIELSFDRFHDF